MPSGVYDRPKPAKEEILRRFWSKVVKTDDCWNWIGAGSKHGGHGQIRLPGQLIHAHRFSYELHKGPIPEGLVVRHECDNPPCVNPKHLLLGTQQDNSWDMMNRQRRRLAVPRTFTGTGLAGEANNAAKLNSETVVKIRELRGKMSQKQIGKLFSISSSQVANIQLGRCWRG